MFFYLSKILDFVFMPVIWILAVLLIAVLTQKRRRRNRNQWLLAGLILLIFFTNPFLANVALKQWERPYRQTAEIRHVYDYAIVLGGMAAWDKDYGRLTFADGNDRLMQALDLYKTGKVRQIVISGGSGSIFRDDEKEASFLKDYLLRFGIPAKDLMIESASRNTRENARYVAHLLKGKGGSSILITSALHMKRAEGCFMKEGVTALTWPTDRLAPPESKKFEPGNLLIPSAASLYKWEKLLREMAGYYIYAAVGYL